MKNISIITGQLEKGGQEKQLILLLKDSINSNYSITLFNWSGLYDQGHLDLVNSFNNVSYISLGNMSFFKKLKILYLKARDSIALICFTSYLNFISFILSIFLKIKFAGAARITLDIELKRFSGWVNLLLVPNILSNSKSALKELKKKSLFNNHHLLNNRLDITNIPSIQTSIKHRSISISTVNERKNLNYLIELAVLRKKQNKTFNHIHLGDGPLLDYYKDLLIELDLSDSISFLGKVDNVFKYLNSSNLFLHFSYYEGTPNAILEALSLGLYVIAIKSGDLSYLVNNHSGYISDNWDLKAFDKVIDKFHEHKIGQNNLPDIYQYSNDGSYFTNLINIITKK